MRNNRPGAAVAKGVRLCCIIALLAGPLAAGVAVDDAAKRLDELEGLLGRRKATNAELVSAVDAVGVALRDLDAAADAKESKRFRDRAADVLLKALRLEQVDEATKKNLRNDVQLAAARALRHIDPANASDVMRVVERHILKDRPYDVDPSFYDAILDPLLRLRAEGTFEWILDKVVNADTAVDSCNQALAGLDALTRLPATGVQRCEAVKRILAIYQSYMFHVEDDAFEVAGFRGTSQKTRILQAAGPYWEAIRPTVMRALRELSLDPRTGLPPLDLDTKGEIEDIERHKVWFGQNKTPGRAPWLDGPVAARARTDVPYIRPVPLAWIGFGEPWQEAWLRTRRILDSPLPAAAWRDELRAKVLPGLATKALEDPAWEVRAAAVLALARIAAEGAGERMRTTIDRDKAEPVREAAMLGLLLLADASDRDYLRAHSTDTGENPRLRGYALLALGFLKDADTLRAVVASDDAPEDLRACAVRALGYGGGTAAELAALLADRRAPQALRGEAGTALVDVGDRSVFSGLLPILKERVPRDGVPLARTSLALAAPLCAPDDVKELRRLGRQMDDGYETFAGVRALLAGSFAGLGGARGTEILVEEYGIARPKSTRYGERGHFLLALGRSGRDPAKEVLEKEIDALDHDWDLGACALGLALANDPTKLQRLRALLPERTDTYAPYGMMALALLADPASRTIVRDAIEARRSDAVLEEGALALALLDGSKAVPDLLALWERGRRGEHYDAFAWAFRLAAAPEAIDPLRALVEGDRDPLQRAFALMALGRMADPADPLHRLARGSNPYTGNATLLDLARGCDAAPLLD